MTTAVATTGPKTIIQVLQTDAMKKQMALALPKHCTIDRFMRMAVTSIRKNPALAECTQESVFACLMDLSQLGIEADGRRAHLIPFKKECTLIIDYKGLVELALRSNMVSTIHADVVCENDSFEFSYGSGGTLKHVPCLKGDRGEPYGAYSYAKMKDGSESYEWMNEADIMKIKAMAPGARTQNSPWNSKELIVQLEMWKKTVLRRHSKWLPLSSEFRDAAEKDNEAIEADYIDMGTVPETPVPEKKVLPKVTHGKAVSRASAKKPPVEEPPPQPEEDPAAGEPTDEPPTQTEEEVDALLDGKEPKAPAVKNGVTGAREPLGAKKRRTLANPDA